MKKRTKVTEIMTTKLQTISLHGGNIESARDVMVNNNIRHLPVVNEEKLLGIISLTDIHRISFGANYGQEGLVDKAIFESLKLENVMAHNPVVISPETTIREAAEILSKEEFHALPVVSGEGLVGIVTSTDLIKFLLDQF